MAKIAVEPLNKEEMDSILDSAISNDYYYLLFFLAKTTGRRLGELYDIQIRDINLSKGFILTKIEKLKRRASKEAILTNEALISLKQYISRNNLQLDDYLFKRVSMRAIQYAIKRYAKLAGIKKNVVFHNFRHYFITELVRKGWSYNQIRTLTGHTNIATLLHYDSVTPMDLAVKVREDVRNI